MRLEELVAHAGHLWVLFLEVGGGLGELAYLLGLFGGDGSADFLGGVVLKELLLLFGVQDMVELLNTGNHIARDGRL